MRKSRVGFYFVLPWVLGFAIFTIVPMLSAVYISMTDWSIVGNAGFIGLNNYKELFRSDAFYHSLWVTIRYAILAVPLTIITSLTISVLLSKKIRGAGIYRVIYYM
ncbi:MAG: sugar ABC transporter permease, partial [Acholeplasmataceae bacterium]|nr:sugar ABC transporter permease [Acholeplasmataceae bacterium]